MLHGLRALLLYELNRLDEAGAALEQGLTALVEQSSIDSMIMGTVALARLQNARLMHLDALETLSEGEALGWLHDLPRLAIALAAERIDLLLRQHEVGQASEQWRALISTVENRKSEACSRVLRDKVARVEARLALLDGQFRRAAECIEPALAFATQTGQRRKQVELLILHSLAADGANEREQALSRLDRALEIAMSEGYVRVFVDEGESLRKLLVALAEKLQNDARTARKQYAQVLISAFSSDGRNISPRLRAAPIESLTRRELKILAKLQSSLSNRELSDAMFITEGTLKWHLGNIYSKLGVSSRLAAIEAGRDMGLIR